MLYKRFLDLSVFNIEGNISNIIDNEQILKTFTKKKNNTTIFCFFEFVRVAFYILGFIIKNYKILKNIVLLFFTTIFIEINTFLHSLQPVFEVLFLHQLRHLQNMFFEHINCFFRCQKTFL